MMIIEVPITDVSPDSGIYVVRARDRNWKRHWAMAVRAKSREVAMVAAWNHPCRPRWASKRTLDARPADPNTDSYWADIRRSKWARPSDDMPD